jgi:uncharacterized membrane protein YkoI
MKMIYMNRFLPLAVIGAGLAVSLPVISKADDPKETTIQGSIRLRDEGNQEAAQANLATIPVQTAINTAISSQGGTVLRAELQNEDGFLVYNVELVVPGDKRVHEVKVDAGGTGKVLRIDVGSADRETENGEPTD